MADPHELYTVDPDGPAVPSGLPLVAAITGFTDAGSTVSQVSDYLLEALESRHVLSFDYDQLLDYRARRPTFYFDQDHFTDYVPPRLDLHLVDDELGQPFLLLSGYEPDFQWERFTTAVMGLVEQYKVSTTTWINSIPMPVPHTRALGFTISGNRAELTEAFSVWRPHSQVPGNAMHLLEYRLQQKNHPVASFVLLVPHYLADTEYPTAAIAAVEGIGSATGLILPTDDLRDEERGYLQKVEEQVAGNAELQRLVQMLEERHDDYMQNSPLRQSFTDEDGELPSADEIAAELEKFLASRRGAEDEPEA